MQSVLFSLMTSLGLACTLLPGIVHMAHRFGLCAGPTPRCSHRQRTPCLGGIALFFGLLVSLLLWSPAASLEQFRNPLAGFALLFLVGVRDDLRPMAAGLKLLFQVLVVFGLVAPGPGALFAGGSPSILHGLPPGAAWLLSGLWILVCVNAFNLTDGIDGLAAGIGILVLVVLGSWFGLTGAWHWAVLAFSALGSLLGFLCFNLSPARIFMGDSGALLLGAVCGFLMVEFLALNAGLGPEHVARLEGAPAVAAAILIYPLFDTFRVFFTRLYRGISPFKPDRRHIHHMLIDFGLSHLRATACLVALNAASILFVFALHDRLQPYLLLSIPWLVALVLTAALHTALRRRRMRQFRARSGRNMNVAEPS